jgi:hypothetical protein
MKNKISSELEGKVSKVSLVTGAYRGIGKAIALSAGTETIALDQVVKLRGPSLEFYYLINFLLKVDCHFVLRFY